MTTSQIVHDVIDTILYILAAGALLGAWHTRR